MSVWDVGAIEAMPENFLNALPLLSAYAYTGRGGSDAMSQGGHILKYWSPTLLGIAAATPALDPVIGSGLKYQITTPWLDVSPCQFFAVTIIRSIPLLDNVAAKSFKLAVQYKQTAAENPPTSLQIGVGTINDVYNGIYAVSATACVFPALAGAATERWTCLFGANQSAGSECIIAPIVIGPWIRLQMNYALVGPDAGDHSTYSMAILGSS